MSAEDVLAIQRVVADYADAVCRRDEEAWAATWAADCRWELTGGRTAVGRDATVTLWRDAVSRYPWVSQVVTGCLVDLDDSAGTASSGTYILELNRRLAGSGALHLGHYADKFARSTDGGFSPSECCTCSTADRWTSARCFPSPELTPASPPAQSPCRLLRRSRRDCPAGSADGRR